MIVTILDPRTGHRVAISVPDKVESKQRARLRIIRELDRWNPPKVSEHNHLTFNSSPACSQRLRLRAARTAACSSAALSTILVSSASTTTAALLHGYAWCGSPQHAPVPTDALGFAL